MDDIVLGSIAESLDRHPFRETARIQMTKGVVNAERMAHEMEAVIRTLEGLDVSAIMSRATRDKLNWCQALGLKSHFKGEPPASLEAVLAVLLGASG